MMGLLAGCLAVRDGRRLPFPPDAPWRPPPAGIPTGGRIVKKKRHRVIDPAKAAASALGDSYDRIEVTKPSCAKCGDERKAPVALEPNICLRCKVESRYDRLSGPF